MITGLRWLVATRSAPMAWASGRAATSTSSPIGIAEPTSLVPSKPSGFDDYLFADALAALTQITDDAFAEYRIPPEIITSMRRRFANWLRELRSP